MADRNERFEGDREIEWRGGDRDLTTSEPEALRSEIDRSRDRISHTVDEIADRLDPDRLKRQLKHDIHDATVGKAEHMARVAVNRVDDTRHDLMDTLRENPIPAAMVGIGLGWLLMNRRQEHGHQGRHAWRSYPGEPGWRESMGRSGSHEEPSLGERVSSMGESAKERAGEWVDRAQDRVTGFVEDARDTAREVTDRVQSRMGSEHPDLYAGPEAMRYQRRQQVHRWEDRLEEALHDSPLAMGAAAMAIGLAVGLSAPSTERESELMGGMRDELFDRVQEKKEELTGRIEQVSHSLQGDGGETNRSQSRSMH